MSVDSVPLRVDLIGGWLDVPGLTLARGYVINCAITPKVSKSYWPYKFGGGLGGSAANAILRDNDPFLEELKIAGWQDPAVILETGLCAWHSGPTPVLAAKFNPSFLEGHMALMWTGKPHATKDLTHLARDFDDLGQRSRSAYDWLLQQQAAAAFPDWPRPLPLVAATQDHYPGPSFLFSTVVDIVKNAYTWQLKEGMKPLRDSYGERAKKYCGSGHGGYALYLFDHQEERDDFVIVYNSRNVDSIAIEPYMNDSFSHSIAARAAEEQRIS